ncbi:MULTISPECIES: VWA domain-containing protein [unclassified Actinopolyspora]|uniref:VWA domain-containing protein n=1 Tax=unclassified Actinopolyspora TaxID=2639451 RepID=UPI0013F6596E|nr:MULTISPECIES: VWA domain-containing protein [unclassified Actinopolyspora]NHD19499.1 VWA domain-containing protein [Actinopolyspora sp. BKK2]NHE77439.1 VWA domain-containing protein [Actinopolyspora sp. BKK1]
MYGAEINRRQPACLLLLIDQSHSMSEFWADTGTSKAQQLAMAVNRVLSSAVLQCSKGDDRVYDYFEVGVLGYGLDTAPVLHGTDASRPLIPVSEVAENPRRVDEVPRKIPDGAGGLVETTLNMPVWVDPTTNGKTPMVQALRWAESIVESWCAAHPKSFPPIVLNLTDGMSTDGDPTEAGKSLQCTGTQDGAALLFNAHISGGQGQEITFPVDSGLPNEHAETLFHISSPLPSSMAEAASQSGYSVEPGARGFLYNAQPAAVIEFLDIGTRAATPSGLAELPAGGDASG